VLAGLGTGRLRCQLPSAISTSAPQALNLPTCPLVEISLRQVLVLIGWAILQKLVNRLRDVLLLPVWLGLGRVVRLGERGELPESCGPVLWHQAHRG
jgi:hypothetical protein